MPWSLWWAKRMLDSVWEPQMAVLELDRAKRHVVIYMPYDEKSLSMWKPLWMDNLEQAVKSVNLSSFVLCGND